MTTTMRPMMGAQLLVLVFSCSCLNRMGRGWVVYTRSPLLDVFGWGCAWVVCSLYGGDAMGYRRETVWI